MRTELIALLRGGFSVSQNRSPLDGAFEGFELVAPRGADAGVQSINSAG